MRLGQSDTVAAPGHRVTLTLDVTPGPKIHVYAPGQAGYIPIDLALTASPDLKIAPPTYPSPRSFFFAPLKETVRVYDRPFRITQDVTLMLTQDLRRRALAKDTLTMLATLNYQACDDQVCFRPDAITAQWALTLTPIER